MEIQFSEIKERKEEYAGYLAIFIYIIEDDNSEINAIYTAGEMIKTFCINAESYEFIRPSTPNLDKCDSSPYLLI